jgi:hypothetical protein
MGWVSFNSAAQILPEEYPAYAGPKYIDPLDNLESAVRRITRV